MNYPTKYNRVQEHFISDHNYCNQEVEYVSIFVYPKLMNK